MTNAPEQPVGHTAGEKHEWRLSWFGHDVQEVCDCGAYRTCPYDGDGDWVVFFPAITRATS